MNLTKRLNRDSIKLVHYFKPTLVRFVKSVQWISNSIPKFSSLQSLGKTLQNAPIHGTSPHLMVKLHKYTNKQTKNTVGFSKPSAPWPSTRPVRSVWNTGVNQSPANEEALLPPCLFGSFPSQNSPLLFSELLPILLHQREAFLASWPRPVRGIQQSASRVSDQSGTGNRLAG